MAIIGMGTDIIEISRIAQAAEKNTRFARRILTETEWDIFNQQADPVRYLAKRFAAKEAAAKALQTGIGRGISWHHLEIANHDSGAPFLILSQGALQVFKNRGGRSSHLSISDEARFAVATVIFEN